MAKHLNSTNSDVELNEDSKTRLLNLLLNEPASWIQALIMALPGLAYLSVYCIKHYKYNRFGISPDLITVRLEDVLLVLLLTMSLGWSAVLNWGSEITNSRNSKQLAVFFLMFALLLSFAAQTMDLISISLKCGIAQVYQYVHLTLQFAFLVILFFAIRKVRESGMRIWAKMRAYCFSAFIGYCVLSLGQVSYLIFNLSEYQVCPESNSLVVGYDSQGRAVSKMIFSESESGICCVERGYVLEDVTGKELEMRKYTYLQVSDSSQYPNLICLQKAKVYEFDDDLINHQLSE